VNCRIGCSGGRAEKIVRRWGLAVGLGRDVFEMLRIGICFVLPMLWREVGREGNAGQLDTYANQGTDIGKCEPAVLP
jgi:hypothetical protein